MNKPEFIIIHHSFTPDDDNKREWAAIRNYHVNELGWKDVGYHYGLEKWEGQVAICIGRPEFNVGAHTKEMNMNRRSLGICVVGNYDEKPPEQAKLDMLKTLCLKKMDEYGIIPDNVLGHREVGEWVGLDWRKGEFKTCPGRKFDMGLLRNLLRDEGYKR